MSGRRLLIKKFSGDLSGSARGQAVGDHQFKGSASYVAIDHVTGELDGRKGVLCCSTRAP